MIITSPNKQKTVFLAGTIDNGNSEDWQSDTAKKLSDNGWIVYNPRRKDWDSSWTESIDNLDFRYQVEWELEYLLNSDYVFFYFVPNSVSIVTMLEYGLCLGKNKNMVVVCPDGFHKKGNIQITDRFVENMNCVVYSEFDRGINHLINLKI